MATPIHPKALKSYRDRKRWTQKQLAEATRGRNRVSEPTIKRIESKKVGVYAARDRVANALAKALGVKIDELSRPPSEKEDLEASLREFGYRPLRTMVGAETALAFKMVQQIYGISIYSQIDMAPLFAALLAEGSLAWRRKRVEAIEEASARLQELGGSDGSFGYWTGDLDYGATAERKSIEERDLFGVQVSEAAVECSYDPPTKNPFADYLEMFAQEAQAKTISFDKDFGWKTNEGLPEYRIGADIISQLTGDDPDAEYALLRGHVRMKDIPDDLRGEEKKAERVAWMIARIPEDEFAKRKAKREELFTLLEDLDVAGSTEARDEAKGGDHA